MFLYYIEIYLINIGWIWNFCLDPDPEFGKFKAGSGSGINHSRYTTLPLRQLTRCNTDFFHKQKRDIEIYVLSRMTSSVRIRIRRIRIIFLDPDQYLTGAGNDTDPD